MKPNHAFAIGWTLIFASFSVDLLAQQGNKACGLITPAELATLGTRSSAKPEGTTLPVKKGEGGAPADLAMSVCAHPGNGEWDGANLTVVSAKERVTEKQMNAWLDSDRDGGKAAAPRNERKIGQSLCSTATVPARTDKAGATVTRTPAQHVTSCSRFAGERFVSLDVVQVDKALAPQPEAVNQVLEKVVERLAAQR
ncbi:MAG: hypothetical protein IPL03_13220 [Sterolibacteriaceae bacterium]|nr:hypothetical protein [Candidatus Methylophosphatis haderslevensis]